MPRTARIVIPEIPHHIVQRGNRCQDVFFETADFKRYIDFMHEQCTKAGTEIIAYCLMNNHVHLIAVPGDPEGLRPIGEAHRRYTRYLNAKKGWQGYLWQGRFSSYPMDERYLYEAVRYVELNPVRAKLCSKPEDYPWSSAPVRLTGRSDPLLSNGNLQGMIEDWPAYWQEGLQKDAVIERIQKNEVSQQPQGFFNLGTQ